METNQAETIASLAVKAAGVPSTISAKSGKEYMVVPAGMAHVDVTDPNSLPVPLPKYIKQSVTLHDADAAVEYLTRFKGSDTLLFADVVHSKIVGVIDYHAKEKAAITSHRATLDLAHSEEWKVWSEASGKLMPQLEFARFIEENAPDIKAPDAGTILDAARDLQARRTVNFIKAVRTDSDNENFEFNDNTELRAKGDIEVPSKFVLILPVYFGEAPTEINAFLRWKLDDGKLLLGIKLHRKENVRQAAFKLIVTSIAERSSVPAIYGLV